MFTSLPPISTALPALGRKASNPAEPPASTTSPTYSSKGSVRGASLASVASHGDSTRLVPLPQNSLNSHQQLATSGSALPALDSVADVEMRQVVQHIRNRNIEAIKRWARETQDINATDFAGNTALHWAATRGAGDVVSILLKRGASAKVQNNNGATPLHCAAISGNQQAAELLLGAGCDPMSPNGQGKTFFEICRSKGHINMSAAFDALEARLLAAQQSGVLHNSGESWVDATHLGAESESDTDTAGLSSDHQFLTPTPVKKLTRLQKEKLRIAQQQMSPQAGVEGGFIKRNSDLQERRSLPVSHTIATSKGSRGTAMAPEDEEKRELERRIRLLEEVALSARGSSHKRSPSLGQLVDHTADQAASPNRTVPLIASPNLSALYDGHEGKSNNGVSPRRAEVSPQRFVGPSGRILCSCCDEDDREAAMAYCEECRRSGDPCWFCEDCWRTEHSSKRTRYHRRGPVPIPQSGGGKHLTPRMAAISTDLFPFDIETLSVEARAFLMLQQQMITAFSQQQQANQNSKTKTSETSTHGTGAFTRNNGTQTIEVIQSTYFEQAMFELNDVREQLEGEVHHSQMLIDSTRLQLLEALELRHRAEIETMCYRKLISIRRPPQVVVVYDPTPVPESYKDLPQQRSGPSVTAAFHANKDRHIVTQSPPVLQTTSPPVPKKVYRNATNSQGVQAHPDTSAASAQTDSSGESPPPKSCDDGSVLPRYPLDAVEIVHGEKHLPNQPQMLLVRWRHDGLEAWVPAYEVAHCAAVLAYLARYDKSFNNSVTSSRVNTSSGVRAVSPLNESERTNLSQQLAAIKRGATSGESRESLDGSLSQGKPIRSNSGNVTFLPSSRGMLPSSFQPAIPTASGVDDEDLPMPPPGVVNDDFTDDPSPIPPTPTPDRDDDDLVRKYEEKLKELEDKQKALRRLREDQLDRISGLKNKQQLLDERKRADVNREYEEKAPQLSEQQPEKLHPLQLTTDRHAALVLQKLQEEVQLAEHSKQTRRQTNNGDQASGSEKARSPSTSNATVVPVEKKKELRQPPMPPPAVIAEPQPPAEQTFEQKINRILYEQYFFNRSQADSKKQAAPLPPPVGSDVRPASLN